LKGSVAVWQNKFSMRASVSNYWKLNATQLILDIDCPEYRFCHVLRFGIWWPWPYRAKRTKQALTHISRKRDLPPIETLLESILTTPAAGIESVEPLMVHSKRQGKLG
jgi:hypothetical protein